jgi:signal peptidase I
MIYPKDTSKDFIKRVIGLPNETVVIKDGSVYIKNQENPEGFLLDEEYVKLPKSENLVKELGKDEYFVMGDNRAGSFDSRYWGPLPKKDVIGRPIIRLLPVDKIGFYPGKKQNEKQ